MRASMRDREPLSDEPQIDRPAPKPAAEIRQCLYFSEFLNRREQEELLGDVRNVAAAAPLFSPETRYGKKMSVRMTSAGKYGWYSDAKGYRYETRHPSGSAWPSIPERILRIWRTVTGLEQDPECCLVNFYGPDARMGMHQDRDEADFRWPVVSVSLGDDALFRIGNAERGGKTESIWLRSGDVLVMGGEARLIHHGIDRIRPGTSTLLREPGRVNLTLRVVD